MIIGDGLVALSSVADGVKMNSPVYIEFLRINLQSLLNEKYWLSNKMIFIHDNTPAHTGIATVEYLTELMLKMSGKRVQRILLLSSEHL